MPLAIAAALTGVVQVVRRRVVHDLDVGIVEQRLVAAVRLARAERLRLLLGRRLAAPGDRDDVDEAEPPDRIDVMRPDEAGADETHPDPFHGVHSQHSYQTSAISNISYQLSAISRQFTNFRARLSGIRLTVQSRARLPRLFITRRDSGRSFRKRCGACRYTARNTRRGAARAEREFADGAARDRQRQHHRAASADARRDSCSTASTSPRNIRAAPGSRRRSMRCRNSASSRTPIRPSSTAPAARSTWSPSQDRIAFRGSAFEFLRNDAFDAKNFFAATKEKLERNQFGGTFGGPVVIPGLVNGRGRTFFFASYEGQRRESGRSGRRDRAVGGAARRAIFRASRRSTIR